jgi:hypothetical protein
VPAQHPELRRLCGRRDTKLTHGQRLARRARGAIENHRRNTMKGDLWNPRALNQKALRCSDALCCPTARRAASNESVLQLREPIG